MGFKERIEFFVCKNYRPDRLKRAIAFLLEKLSFQVPSGTWVLVKPNLVSARNAALSCTHPEMVRAVCEWLIEKGAEVPLWQTAQKMRLYGARPEEVAFPSDFPDLSDFGLPEKLSPVTFHPLRLIRGLIKRLFSWFK